MSGDILGCYSSGRVTSVSWVETIQTAAHPVIHTIALTTRNNLALTVCDAAGRKCYLRSCNWRMCQSLQLISIFLLLETLQELFKCCGAFCCLFYFYFLGPHPTPATVVHLWFSD